MLKYSGFLEATLLFANIGHGLGNNAARLTVLTGFYMHISKI